MAALAGKYFPRSNGPAGPFRPNRNYPLSKSNPMTGLSILLPFHYHTVGVPNYALFP